MKPIVTFTSTLSSSLFDWVTEHAKEQNVTKRAVLENALQMYYDDVKRKKLAATFQAAAEDKDVKEMAEWGMGDYFDIIEKHAN